MAAGSTLSAQQGKGQAINDLPNPYRTVDNFFTRPGRAFGSTSAVDIDRDGRSIWVAERCGGNSGCLANPAVDPILLYDQNGRLVRSFGAGLIVSPHGIHVDREGNVWIADYQDDVTGGRSVPALPNAARGAGRGAGRGAAAAAPDDAPAGRAGARGAAGAGAGAGRARGAGDAAARGRGAADAPAGAPRGRGDAAAQGPIGIGRGGPNAAATMGHQVHKFSPDGKLLMSLGKPGGGAPGAGTPEYFYQPNDVITNPAGEIFVSERHGSGGRILKFSKDGKFIKAWGEAGNGPGQFNIPHSLAFDSKGRLFVADRGNVRIQIFDQEGKFLEEWYQFSRLSGIYIDKNDMVYGADSESSPTSNPGGWRRGIRIGSAKDGKVQYFIPDPEHTNFKDGSPGGTSAAEGVAVDAAGNVYGAEVGPRAVKKYQKK
jgi:sugar lactone lactonase YvrE